MNEMKLKQWQTEQGMTTTTNKMIHKISKYADTLGKQKKCPQQELAAYRNV